MVWGAILNLTPTKSMKMWDDQSPGRGQTSRQGSNVQELSLLPRGPVQRYNEPVPSVLTTWGLKVVFVPYYTVIGLEGKVLCRYLKRRETGPEGRAEDGEEAKEELRSRCKTEEEKPNPE